MSLFVGRVKCVKETAAGHLKEGNLTAMLYDDRGARAGRDVVGACRAVDPRRDLGRVACNELPGDVVANIDARSHFLSGVLVGNEVAFAGAEVWIVIIENPGGQRMRDARRGFVGALGLHLEDAALRTILCPDLYADAGARALDDQVAVVIADVDAACERRALEIGRFRLEHDRALAAGDVFVCGGAVDGLIINAASSGGDVEV